MDVLLIEDNADHAAVVAALLDAADPGAFAVTVVPSLAEGITILFSMRR